MSWFYDGVERVCSGSTLRVGPGDHDSMLCHETPQEVRALMLVAPHDLIELHHQGAPDQVMYVDWKVITVISPYWAVVKTG